MNFSAFMTKILTATAWGMEKPQAWHPFHLCFLLIGLFLCACFGVFIRKKKINAEKIILTSSGLFLIVTEIYKQLFYTYYIGGGQYQWWIFPFQLCSVPMYLCVIAPWLKDGPVKRGMYNFLVFYNLFGAFISFLEPSGLCHEYWTLTLHAFIWHMTLIFIGVYLIASKKVGLRFRDYFTSVGVFMGLALIAFGINCALNKVSNYTINMFFVGPNITSLAVFNNIATKCGWFVNTIIYVTCLSVAAFIVFMIVRLLSKLGTKKTKQTA